MEKTEHGVDDAVFLQQGLPGHGALSRKFIHIGMDEDQDDEAGSCLPFNLLKIMARG